MFTPEELDVWGGCNISAQASVNLWWGTEKQKNVKVQLYSHKHTNVNDRYGQEAHPSVIQSGGGSNPLIPGVTCVVKW